MSKPISLLTNEEIGKKISAGNNFWVNTNDERKAALMAAKFAGKQVSSRKEPKGGFNIFFLTPISK